MKVLVLKENLTKVIPFIGRNISSRPQLPILSNILFKTEKGKLKLSVTNLELGLQFFIPAKIEEEGETTVPGKILTEFISSVSADKLEFSLEGNNILVRTNKTKASFATIPATDFPPFPETETVKNTLPYKKIKDAVTRTAFAASNDEGRPVLTGIRTSVRDGQITFAATDGYRLSIEHVAVSDKQDNFQLILPAYSLSETMRIAQELSAEDVGFSIIEKKNQAVFSLPDTYVFSRLIDGEFPNVEKIVPTGYKTRLVVEKDRLLQAVKTTSLFARGAANILRIKIEKDGLRLSANTPQLGEDEDFVEAKMEGEETSIAFNYRFLLDLLNNFPDKDVVFESSGPLNPGVFRPPSNLQFLHLIMPVRVQG